MDTMESIEVIKLYNRTIKRGHSFLLNVLGILKDFSVFEGLSFGEKIKNSGHNL